MIKNPRKHRRQKYENPPITTIKGISYRGESTIYRSTHELNYSHMAVSHVIRILDLLYISPSSQTVDAAESQTELCKPHQTSQRTTTPRIYTYSQKSQKSTKTQSNQKIQTLQRVEKAYGVSAL